MRSLPIDGAPLRWSLLGLYQELLRRESTLTRYAILMALIMIPTMIAMSLDDRTIRDVDIWAKPLKFMASTALFSISTAWYVGLLPESQRRSKSVASMVSLLIATSLFEVLYISFQACLGQGSHYNTGDAFHSAMFALMAIAAWGLTATQAWLALLVWRSAARPFSTWSLGVVIGLGFTFVLGSASGMMLGARQPPIGVGLSVVGWHLTGGDVRPAHFLGVHAQQLVPLIGLVLLRVKNVLGTILLCLISAIYLALWGGLAVTSMGPYLSL